MEKNLSNKHLIAISAAAILFSAFMLLGMTGARTVLAIFVLFGLPAYFILSQFKLEPDEKIFFSFFIGIGLFAILPWYVNRIVPSLRASTFVAFTLLLAIGQWLRMKKSGNS